MHVRARVLVVVQLSVFRLVMRARAGWGWVFPVPWVGRAKGQGVPGQGRFGGRL